MQARYYDPVVGRFYSNDPVDALEFLRQGSVQGFARYTDANNDPYKYTDPDGRASTCQFIPECGAAKLKVVSQVAGAVQQATEPGSTTHEGAKVVEKTVEVLSSLKRGKGKVPKEPSLYRGVSAKHPELAAAKNGDVVPGNLNGKVTPEQHNRGGHAADSPFTSWSRDPDIAAQQAAKHGPGGVVLRVPQGAPPKGSSWSWEWSPDIYGEQEVLLRGLRSGAEVLK